MPQKYDSNYFINKRSKECSRVLFLRSHSKICSFSMIANGLCHSQQIDFAQYPPFPEQFRPKLQKMYDSDAAWEHLNCNLIADYAELREKLVKGYFDLILIADNFFYHLSLFP